MSSKVMRRQLNLRARLIVILLLIVAVAGIVYTVLNSSGSPIQTQSVSVVDKKSYEFSINGLVSIDDRILSYDDLINGKSNWSLELLDDNFLVTSSDHIIAVYNDRVVQAMDFEGNALFDMIEFASSRVESVRCGTNYLAVLRRNPNGDYAISLISRTGIQLEPVSINQATVLNFDYFDADNLWVMTVNTDSGTTATTISTYSGGEAVTGVMNIEGELIESVYPGTNAFYVAGTNVLHAFVASGREEARRTIYGWEVFDFAESSTGIRFLAVPRNARQNDDSCPAKIVTLPASINEVDLRLPAHCIGAFFVNGRLTAITNDTIYLYQDDGSIYKEYRLDFAASTATKLKNGKILLKNDSQAVILTIDVK